MNPDEFPITGLVLHFRTIERTLSCLRSQHLEGIKRAVIVDNSEDGGKTLFEMEQELSILRDSGFNTVVLSSGRNLGFAGGVAYGLKYVAASVQPSHVLLLNSDARLMPGSLELMRRSLADAAIVAPSIAQGGRPPSSAFSYYDRLLGLITQTPKIAPVRHASGCCLLIHYDLTSTSLFDKDFFFYGEDVMLGFDQQRNGIKVKECPAAVIEHSPSSSAKNGSMFYEYHMNRSHWLLSTKLSRTTQERYLFITARCITLPSRALVRSLRSRSLIAWKGLWAATYDTLRKRFRSFTPPPS